MGIDRAVGKGCFDVRAMHPEGISVSRECPTRELLDFYKTRGRTKCCSLHGVSRVPNGGIEFHEKSAPFAFSCIDGVREISGMRIEQNIISLLGKL